MNERDLSDALGELLETYPDGHIHQGAWFYLTRGDFQLAVSAADPQRLDEDVELWNVARFPMKNGVSADKPDFSADVPSGAVMAVLDAITPTITVRTQVLIPGDLIAFYEEGRILGFQFSPSASDAGYFGPHAEVDEGDQSLDVADTDGPFWKAVQTYLSERTGDFEGTWTE